MTLLAKMNLEIGAKIFDSPAYGFFVDLCLMIKSKRLSLKITLKFSPELRINDNDSSSSEC